VSSQSVEVQRKHHFVWSWHLSRWAQNGRDVHYTTSTGKIGFDSVRGLAREIDFYRASILNPFQVEILKVSIDTIPSGASREFLHSMLQRWLSIQSGLETSVIPELADEFKRVRDALECNFMETLHTAHELEARKAMEALLQDDTSLLSDTTRLLPLCMYVGQATMRTKHMRDSVAKSRSEAIEEPTNKALAGAWWFLSFVHGAAFGQGLYRSLHSSRISLLATTPEAPFIISDQPIVNMHPDVAASLDMVMPLSPLRAIAICDSDRFSPGLHFLECDAVDAINRLQAERSTMIFASSEEHVRRYSMPALSRR